VRQGDRRVAAAAEASGEGDEAPSSHETLTGEHTMASGSLILSDVAARAATLDVKCNRCDRAGRYKPRRADCLLWATLQHSDAAARVVRLFPVSR